MIVSVDVYWVMNVANERRAVLTRSIQAPVPRWKVPVRRIVTLRAVRYLAGRVLLVSMSLCAGRPVKRFGISRYRLGYYYRRRLRRIQRCLILSNCFSGAKKINENSKY